MSHDEPELPPGLRPFIEAAREQPIVATRVTAEAVAAGLEHARRRQQARRVVILSAATAIAASILAVVISWSLLGSREDAREAPPTAEVEIEQPEGETSVEAPPTKPPALASAVRLRSTATIEVRDAWAIALGEGTHELEVDPVPDRALTVALPDRALELVEGRMTIEVVDGVTAVRLHTGVAAWIEADGRRTSISVEHIELEPTPAQIDDAPTEPSAAELAREAERLLTAGERDAAIAVYRKLIRAHPRASQTRAAVLDLARLLRAAKREDEARCAYRLFLERWPSSSVRAEVESQLERLGPGPSCRGLKPGRP